MDAERLHEVVVGFVSDADSLAVGDSLRQLNSLLESALTSISPSTEQQFKDALSSFMTRLSSAPSNQWPPSKLEILRAVGLARFAGDTLRSEITRILSADSGIARAGMLNEMRNLLTEFSTADSHARALATAMRELRIPFPPAIPQGFVEVGFLLPNSIDTSRIDGTVAELRWIDRFVRTLAEIEGEEIQSAPLASVSKGSLIVAAAITYAVATVVLNMVERVVDVWTKIADLQLKRRELAKLEAGEEVLAALDRQIEQRLAVRLAEIAREHVAEHDLEPGRANELETALRQALKELARRIDLGARVEVVVRIEHAPGTPEPPLPDNLRALASQGAVMRDTPRLDKPVLQLTADPPDSPDV